MILIHPLMKCKRVVETLSSKDMEMVLKRLGLHHTSNGGNFPSRLDENDVFALFESRSPRLDEVEEALMCSIRTRMGSKMEEGRRMIGAFDENGDGMMDFDEFVKFMENSSL
ncbi:probable calcium-binding protein CML46 [Primulina eburnea]|uniref:probable calcium-binding protein CML46 n=1 Tax=Primulina eburnea TaxID=1245227 RepID=UPI003C6C647F